MATLDTPITERDHIRGPARAPVTLVEYGDYQCPHCALAHRIVGELMSRFGDRTRFVFRHFPLVDLHPFAESAAESAEYAAEQGRFWEMHDALYENQETLDPMSILSIGAQLGLSHTELRKALETGRYREKVQSDYMSGVRSGVNGTPTFFINGVRHDGSYDFASLASAIQPHVEASTNA